MAGMRATKAKGAWVGRDVVGAPAAGSYVTATAEAGLANERVLTAGAGISVTDGGPNSTITVANTAPEATTVINLGTTTYGLFAGNSGAQQQLRSLIAGTGISMAASATEVTITCTVTQGAPTGASYVTVSAEAGLSAERVLTAGSGISVTDGGANTTVTVANTSPESTTVINLGTTTYGLFAGVAGTQQQLKSLIAGTGISMAASATEVTITNSVVTFLALSDTPNTYAAQGGYRVVVNAVPDALVFEANTFINMDDTPASYAADNNGRAVRVNAANNAVEFIRAGISYPANLVDAATIAVDLSKGDLYRVTLTVTRILGNPTNPTDGQKWILEVKQPAGGACNLTFEAKYRFSTDLPLPVLTGTANKIARYGFIYRSADDKHDLIAFLQEY